MEDKDLSIIVKSIDYGRNKNKYSGVVSYKMNVTLVNNTVISMPVDKSHIDYLRTLRELNNGVEPIKSKKLVRSVNAEGKEYNCVIVTLINDDVLRYVEMSFSHSKIIDLLYSSLEKKQVENKK